MKPHAALTVFLALCAAPAVADVFVLGNSQTGQVALRGNFPNGAESAEALKVADAEPRQAWTMLLQSDEKGWGAVACVRTKETVYFSVADGQASESDAMREALGGAKMYIQKNGDGILVPNCAPRWDNEGQQIALDGDKVPEWRESDHGSDAMEYIKGTVRSATGAAPDFKRDCVHPQPPSSAEAKLRPIGNGTAPLDATMPKPKSEPKPKDTWKPQPWCKEASSGVRG
jgi:hypothetical protein